MRNVLLVLIVTTFLTACAPKSPACNSPDVLALVERIQMDGLHETQKELGAVAVEKAFLPYKLQLMLSSESEERKAQLTDSVRKSFEAQYNATLPKLSLAYSNVMTEKDPAAVGSRCKVQVDLSINGVKKHNEVSNYTARYTDDKKLFVEASKLNISQ